MTVAEMLERMSSVELTRWMVFFKLEPFGSYADHVGAAITACTIANINRKPKSKAHSVEEFMPKFGKKKKQSTKEMLQVASMITIASGGEDNR